MWVASWFSGIPDLGSRLIETPKFLANVLAGDTTPTAKLVSLPVRSMLNTVRDSADFKLTDASFDANFATVERSEPANWLETIETLLFTPDVSDPQIEQDFPTEALTDRPLSQLVGTVQSLFWGLPGIDPEDSSTAVAVVEVGFDGTILEPKRGAIQRFGFWQCPTWHSRPSEQTAMGGFQIWVKGCEIATLPDRASAESLANRLERVLEDPNFDASQLHAAIVGNQPGGKLNDRPIFVISEELSDWLHRPAELIAIEWINNLRIALGQTTIDLAEAQVQMYGLESTGGTIDGMASWYGPYFHGRETANGEIFDQHELTAAHPSLPLGTYLKVTNQLNGKSIVVRVNDRGPYFDNRVLDLSNRAAQLIDGEEKGVVPIEAIVMQPTILTRRETPQQVARLVTGY